MGWLDRAPKLELDWEQGLFLALRGLWRSVAPSPSEPEGPHIARLVPMQARLNAVGGLVAGRPVRVRVSPGEGGLRGVEILAPPWVGLAPDLALNQGLYVLRVALAAQALRMGAQPGPGLAHDLAWMVRAATALSEELPAFSAAYADACALELALRPPLERLRGRARAEELLRRAALQGHAPTVAEVPGAGDPGPMLTLWGRLLSGGMEHSDPGEVSSEGGVPPQGHEVEAPPVESLKLHELKDQEGLQLPSHSFEKVETADAFNGVMRDLDGLDELEDQLEALQEVPLGDLLRGGPPAQALLRADIDLDIEVPHVGSIAPTERAVPVDEWDHKARLLRPGWCQVYPSPMGRGDAAWAVEALGRNRRHIDQMTHRLRVQREALRAAPRQLDGEEVDLDALVAATADLAAGHSPDPRLYTRLTRQRPDTATLVLMDLSLSTDAWVQNRRVLDVCRDAVLVLGEVAERLGDRLAVMAFASQTRNAVRVWQVRGWEEPWTRGRDRLGALHPQGYTRIGPALRYAAARLDEVRARRRVLLLLSDGKPTDYDRYEGRYGLADVEHAVRGARARGMRVHTLAVADQAQPTLPAMMGPGGWSLMPKVEGLVDGLVKVYGQAT